MLIMIIHRRFFVLKVFVAIPLIALSCKKNMGAQILDEGHLRAEDSLSTILTNFKKKFPDSTELDLERVENVLPKVWPSSIGFFCPKSDAGKFSTSGGVLIDDKGTFLTADHSLHGKQGCLVDLHTVKLIYESSPFSKLLSIQFFGTKNFGPVESAIRPSKLFSVSMNSESTKSRYPYDFHMGKLIGYNKDLYFEKIPQRSVKSLSTEGVNGLRHRQDKV
jgi:hypothetical protein